MTRLFTCQRQDKPKVIFDKTMKQTPRTEFAQALKAIATERGLDAEVIILAIKQAIVAAYDRDRRDQGEEILEDTVYDAEIDSITGETKQT